MTTTTELHRNLAYSDNEYIREYYSRPKIANCIAKFCEAREAIPVYRGGVFGARPGVINYPSDLEMLVKKGALVFHGSLERWANPLFLNTKATREQMNKWRLGWDMAIDIDSKDSLEYAKTAVLKIADILQSHEITNFNVKFSGNRGFHIILPFELFPQEFNDRPSKELFPEIPRMIMGYIASKIAPELEKEFGDDPDKFLSFDRGVFSQRHLIRAPYSLHFETGLASVYVEKDKIESFDPESAKPENLRFFEPQINPVNGEASALLEAAREWSSTKIHQFDKPQNGKHEKYKGRGIHPRNFPPCIKNILNGLEDGKKRSIFILISFLRNVGWKKESIYKWLLKWNEKNRPPLPVNDIDSTFRAYFSRETPAMAPNCNHPGYYMDFDVCTPDSFCPSIKNPVTYALKKAPITESRIRHTIYRGREMYCLRCKYNWNIRKRHGLPPHCPRCGFGGIRLSKWR